ncbi:MAG TPA: septal ring lytic transglycosylase RlpA family protein [Flavobacteriaceae bacterium]|nr:septal ring lytic transglycosylase RlpA family protein [Flavobacteriaceae bacterium]
MLFFCSLIGFSQTPQLTGKASFYGEKFNGKPTASGEIFESSKLTAAHPNLPFGTNVKVTNLSNNKSVIVRVNDRGPFVMGRIIDLSKAAAEMLGFIQKGIAGVSIEILKP